MSKEKKYKPRRSGLDTAITTILVIVILVVLGLSVYSIGNKIKSNLPETAEETAPATVQTTAEEKGLTVDEFIAEYGLTDVTAETSMTEVYEKMTCGNYAKLNNQTFEDLVAQNELPESVTADTLWGEAVNLIPIGVAIGGDEAFAEMKATYGLDDSITADTPYGEAWPVIEQKMMEQYEAQQAAASEAPAEAVEAPVEAAE